VKVKTVILILKIKLNSIIFINFKFNLAHTGGATRVQVEWDYF